jgi:hypothetical protein
MDDLPEWIDRRTAEWCAQLCDAVAVRSVLHDRRRGAETCASVIRWQMTIGKPALPATVPAVEISAGDISAAKE